MTLWWIGDIVLLVVVLPVVVVLLNGVLRTVNGIVPRSSRESRTPRPRAPWTSTPCRCF